MAKYLIDEYGEMLGEFKDDVSLRVYNPLNIKRRFIENKLFYKLYKDSTLVFLNDMLNSQTIKTLFLLIRLLNFNTNEFVCINGLPASLNQIANLFNINQKTLFNHLKMLEKIEVIKKVKNGRNKNILINPYFIGYGNSCTDESLKIFSQTIWAKNSNYYKRKIKK